jgi:prophage tail gpP-like protein
MEQLAHSFQFTYVDKWLDGGLDLPLDLPVLEGQACTITVNGVQILQGWLDETTNSYDGESDELSASGRSMAGDLVDCSAVHAGGQWARATVDQIASDLVAPFGMAVTAEAPLGDPLKGFCLVEGETVAEALDRAARFRGLLLTSDGTGNVVFTQAGTTRATTTLAYGRNVMKGERQASWHQRFSQYIVKAQVPAVGGVFGAQATQRKATATDQAVTRYRPLVVVSEDGSSLAVDVRAAWQRNVRAGRSVRYHYTVQGWHDVNTVWAPNVLVHVVDVRFGIEADLLVVTAHLVRDDDGTRTELELCDPAAFTPAQAPTGRAKKNARRKAKAVRKLGS